MKRIILIVILTCQAGFLANSNNYIKYCQDFKILDKNLQLAEHIKKIYKQTPFDGVYFIEMNGESYMLAIGLTTIKDHKRTSTRIRVAQMENRRQVLEFLRKPMVTSEMIMFEDETIVNNSAKYKSGFSMKMSSQTSGFVEGMQVLTAFNSGPDYVYITYKKL